MSTAYDPTDLARALDYPYPAHGSDYLFVDGEVLPLPADEPLDALVPVLAVGSNRAPAQLARKYAGREARIPVTQVAARDVDVAYAARMSPYGSVPATLATSPGTEVELWITWLDGPALARMDETEGIGKAYDRVPLRLAAAGDGRLPATIEAYHARSGLLMRDGGPLAVAAIPARGRRFPAVTEADLLRRLHAEDAARGDDGAAGGFEAWLSGLIGDPGLRRRRALAGRLAATARLHPPPGG